jgi:uncharacterized protein (DUF1778 family)
MAAVEINVRIRFESRTQVERIKKAAKLRKWSMNTFVVHASEEAAARIMTASKAAAEQLITEPEHQTLNQ